MLTSPFVRRLSLGAFAALAVAFVPLLAAQGPKAAAKATAPPPAQVAFQEAKAAAADLPSLLAERELEIIANDELVVAPDQSLRDLRKLYTEVHQWPAENGTAVQKARTRLRLQIEESAIEAFAMRGKFEQVLSWLQGYDPGNEHQGWPDSVYGQVILAMLAKRATAR